MVALASSGKGAWFQYKAGHDRKLREELILRYLPLVKYVAGRVAISLPPHVDVDDLISYGIFGLMEAIERFEPEREVKFETYAVARIRGSILDGLRALDWVPSGIRQKARALESAYARVEADLGRAATDEEMAEKMEMSTDEFRKHISTLAGCALVSLDDLWVAEDESDAGIRAIEMIEDKEAPDPERFAEIEDRKRVLAKAIDRLPEKERLLVSLYYYEGLTAKEISVLMNLSQSRISQLHTKAMFRLRGYLSRYRNDLFATSR